ncbi:hypothetical protein [Mesorhizobium marinum]|uniref:Uncharacterized protein n=1 Tax=Mesorhizobium marinum TaxID=3228790 RepID=A0ABV3R071_9HYPH
MKAVLTALILVLAPVEALAIQRYNSKSMSCAEIKGMLRAEGAAILRWRGRSGNQLYGRFVAHGGFCESGTRAETSYVPSADRKSCPVYECKYWSPDDDFIFRRRGGWN